MNKIGEQDNEQVQREGTWRLILRMMNSMFIRLDWGIQGYGLTDAYTMMRIEKNDTKIAPADGLWTRVYA